MRHLVASGGERVGEPLLDLDRRHASRASARLRRQARARAGEGNRRLCQLGIEVAHQLAPGGRHGHRELGHAQLEAPSQAWSRRPARRRCERSRSARSKPATRGRVVRVESQHQPVEEAASPRGTFGEQAVHRRRQPKQADELAKGVLAAQRRARPRQRSVGPCSDRARSRGRPAPAGNRHGPAGASCRRPHGPARGAWPIAAHARG